jgi:hypothetical protein
MILLIFGRPALINSATGLGDLLLTIYTTKVAASSTIQKIGIAMAASCTGNKHLIILVKYGMKQLR